MRNWKKIAVVAFSVCLLANCVPALAEVGGLMQASATIHAEAKDVVVTGYCGGDAAWNWNNN